MRSVVIVVVLPFLDLFTGMSQRGEQRLVEKLVPEASVDGEGGPAPETGPYSGPTLQKEHSHEPSHRGP